MMGFACPMLQQSLSGFRELQMRSPNLQCRETSECVMACTVSATRFSTPTLRINLATCALTVRSPMPSGVHFIEMASAER